jgi:hypothetical protein
MAVYRDEVVVIPGVGFCEVTTVDFPPYAADNGYEYSGYESVLNLPDGTMLGHGPETVGETPQQLHESWDHDEIARLWLGRWLAAEMRFLYQQAHPGVWLPKPEHIIDVPPVES